MLLTESVWLLCAQEDLHNKLSGRYVMLYISSLEHTSEDEYSNLGDKYKNRSTLYEIVWIPIVDESTSWNEEMEKKFKEIQKSMPWYSISDPSKLDKAVIKYVKEIWNFTGKSLLVVLDPHGDFVKADDVKTFWIWEKSVFVSESDRRKNKLEQVWKGTTIQLLQDTMDPFLTEWVCLTLSLSLSIYIYVYTYSLSIGRSKIDICLNEYWQFGNC